MAASSGSSSSGKLTCTSIDFFAFGLQISQSQIDYSLSGKCCSFKKVSMSREAGSFYRVFLEDTLQFPKSPSKGRTWPDLTYRHNGDLHDKSAKIVHSRHSRAHLSWHAVYLLPHVEPLEPIISRQAFGAMILLQPFKLLCCCTTVDYKKSENHDAILSQGMYRVQLDSQNSVTLPC